jgi:hypothetical protein
VQLRAAAVRDAAEIEGAIDPPDEQRDAERLDRAQARDMLVADLAVRGNAGQGHGCGRRHQLLPPLSSGANWTKGWPSFPTGSRAVEAVALAAIPREHDRLALELAQTADFRPKSVNITGFTPAEFSMQGKKLEMLKEIAPQITRVAVLFNLEQIPQAGMLRGGPPSSIPTLPPRCQLRTHAP